MAIASKDSTPDAAPAAAAEDEVIYELHGHVGVITLNRPEARNALTWRTYKLLEDAVRTTSARCLVITGNGTAFCSGDDVKLVMGGGDKPPEVGAAKAGGPRLTPAADALLHTNVPVIAAVNGAAVGWGMELTMMADLRVASEKARFGELFVLRGLVSDAPGFGRLAQLVGREKAAEMLFTGDIISAEEALRIGLVNSVVPFADVESAAKEMAAMIAANSPPALIATKETVDRATSVDEGAQREGAWNHDLRTTPEHHERFRAAAARVAKGNAGKPG